MKLGIVGLPNVGKSTLFNALTENEVDAENYPFCTIDPNIGVVPVPDDRLAKLEQWVDPPETTPATVEFLDVAGLVRNAHKGEGLGNEFLGQIRTVDAICHVLRVFEDTDVSHVEGAEDPARDREIVETEFFLADLDVVENRLDSLETRARVGEAEEEQAFFESIRNDLKAGRRPKITDPSDRECEWLKEVPLLSLRRMLYVLNVSETTINRPEQNQHYQRIRDELEEDGERWVTLSAELEHELATMDDENRDLFLAEYGLERPGLERLVEEAYDTLGLITYFTYNENELRAWSIESGSTAPEAAGQIHSDFEEGFIQAEVVNFDDFRDHRSWTQAKEAGAVRSRGEDYNVRDGDILYFQFDT